MPRQRNPNTPEVVRVKDDSIYLDALDDFVMKKKELKEISEERNIQLAKLTQWHFSYNWREKRQLYRKQINDDITKRNTDLACEIIEHGFENAKKVLTAVSDGLMYLESLKTEQEKIPTVLTHSKQYQDLTNIALKASQIYNGIKPEVNADLAEKFLSAIQKVKDEIKKEQ